MFGSFEYDQYVGGDLLPAEEMYLAEATAASAAIILGNARGGLLDLDCNLIQYGSIIVTLYFAGGVDDGTAQAAIAESVTAGLLVAAGIQPSRFWVPDPSTAATNNATGTTTKANIPITEVPLDDDDGNLTDVGAGNSRASSGLFPDMSGTDAALALAGILMSVMLVLGIGVSLVRHGHHVELGDESHGVAPARSTVHNVHAGTNHVELNSKEHPHSMYGRTQSFAAHPLDDVEVYSPAYLDTQPRWQDMGGNDE